MYQDPHQLIKAVYDYFYDRIVTRNLPVELNALALVGRVQDDPFDTYIVTELANAFPNLEVYSSGQLTTPDIVIRDLTTGVIIGLEVKKLIQKDNGSDPRGLTLDYNSCLPCGHTTIRVAGEEVVIPCYYLFALLDPNSRFIQTFLLIDGDFINNDFELHKHSKIANQSEYRHGSYQEGSVRRRAMYTYPNPLDTRISAFAFKKALILKEGDCQNLVTNQSIAHKVIRTDLNNQNSIYNVIDYQNQNIQPSLVRDVFAACKARTGRTRTSSSMPSLD